VVYDGKRVFDSDQLLWGGIDRVPRSFIVIGAGVIGIEYASMINVLPGTNVTVIDPRSQLLGFADQEVRAGKKGKGRWGAESCRVVSCMRVVPACTQTPFHDRQPRRGLTSTSHTPYTHTIHHTHHTHPIHTPYTMNPHPQVVDALMYSMRHYGARFMLGEKVERIETLPDRAVVHLASGEASERGRQGGRKDGRRE
jgi:hypothetical protein